LSIYRRYLAAVSVDMAMVTNLQSQNPVIRILIRRCTGLESGAVIGLPLIMNFGSPELKSKIIPQVLSGKKFICLGISEAFSGSNVAGL
jgi:alkylation response protein AidB-like acyl-CoA dehydrogenase